MSVAVSGWASHEIADRSDRRAGRSATAPRFTVLHRRRRRTTASGLAALPTVASAGGANGSLERGENCGSRRLPQSYPQAETGVSPDQEANDPARSLAPYGAPGTDRVTVTASGASPSPVSTPAIAFGDLPSVKAMGTGKKALVVGFDTEFTTTSEGRRVIDSYQFAVPDPEDPSLMVEVVILPEPGSLHRISLHRALWEVVRVAELWRSRLVPHTVGDRGVARSAFWMPEWDHLYRAEAAQQRSDALAKHRVPLVLAAHYGSADLTAFRTGGRERDVDHLARLTSAAGGLVTLTPFRLQRSNENGWWWESISLTVRDAMGHAPAGQQKLKDLGLACGVPKLEVPDDWIERMSDYRREHLEDFLEYGVNDAVIVVEYLARVWGEGIRPPVTLSGGAASALMASGIGYFGEEAGLSGVTTAADFRRIFAGLVDEDDGVDVVEEDDKLSFYAKRGRVPLDGAAGQTMGAYAPAYHGGVNSCPRPGSYPVETFDIDAQNAYPTAMASITDLDWEQGAIEQIVHERVLSLDDVPSPVTAIAAFVSFRFPDDVRYPCLPIVSDGTLLYPRSSDGSAGTWVCGPELWLALQLGVEVFCQIGYIGRVLRRPDGSPSRVLRSGVKQLIDDRNTAKELFGKGSIEETTLKGGVNGIYGKTAQDVAEQRAWDAFAQEMDSVGGSSITSPYHAAMTTSLVRAQMLAAMNEIEAHGGRVFSVTTDGFITDVDVDAVNDLGLYGMAEVLAEARMALTGDPTIWEAKHHQTDLVNFTTRGNVSLQLTGVCAHNGFKIPKDMVEDSFEDREMLLRAVVTRTGRVPNGYVEFPSFQDLSRKEDRRDFLPRWKDRSVSMDFDLKRRPVVDSITAEWVALPDGTKWEMAAFDTEPWERVEDGVRARQIARDIAKDGGCLRTVEQWKEWVLRFEHGKGRRITTPQRALLMSLVMAHRHGVVQIPTLADRSLTVAERLEWLAEWGLGSVTKGDWDNARRPERLSQMLPLDALQPYLDRMQAMPAGDHPSDGDRLPY